MLYERLAASLDNGLGSRARIGLIVLRTDQTIEFEARQVFGHIDSVSLYHSRIYNDFEISVDTLLAMKPLIPEAARLLPQEWAFNAIGFACTSGAMVIGDDDLKSLIQTVHPEARISNPVHACIDAFAALEARRVAVVTPYSRSVNDAIAAGFEKRGLSIPIMVSFEEPNDDCVAKISGTCVGEAAQRAAAHPGVEAVFVSCTSIRAVGAIPDIENTIGKPVTSSNHALLWHLLRLSGIDDRIDGLGTLFGKSPSRRASA